MEGRQSVTQGVSMGSDDQLKRALKLKTARKCSPLFPLKKHRLTERHVQMLAALAQQRALTRDQLRALFFGSTRRCQVALAHMKTTGAYPARHLPAAAARRCRPARLHPYY